MSFNIPGYFLDQKTKKLFKITPHGPYSLKELRKRLQEEEEQEAAAAAAGTSGSSSNGLNTSRQRSPTNITQFLRQRATSNNPLIHTATNYSNNQSGIPFLMTQLKRRTKIQLEGPKHMYNDMLVDLTSDPDYGEIIMAYRSGRMRRFGYQVNPGFQVWNAGHEWTTESSDVLSLQFGTHTFTLNGQERRTIVGTSGGKLWRYSVPKLPSLLDNDLNQQFVTVNGSIRDDQHIIPYPTTSYLGCTESSLDCLFSKKKDLFWSSSIDDVHDHLVVGGDQALYQLTSTFDFVSSRKVQSSIFATHLPKNQPNICWTGSRNGLIQLMDFRQKQQQNINLYPKFKQSSSVTQIQTLTGFELLTMGMDGSVDIWDTRQPTTKNRFDKQQHSYSRSGRGTYNNDRGRDYYRRGWKQHYQQPQAQQSVDYPEPIRKLKGHVNESSHHLGFDIDLENNLLLLAGSDGRVRIWSIFNSTSNEPIWCSEKYSYSIPAAKFMVSPHQYPRVQDGWFSLVHEPTLLRQCPGILLFGANREDSDTSSIEYLTTIR